MENDLFLNSALRFKIKPQTLRWFETPNDYKISMKLSFNIENQNNKLTNN